MRQTSGVSAATAYRDSLLDLARTEAWPNSETVISRLGPYPASTCREMAAKQRAAEHLLGVWSQTDRAFYYPPLQFTSDGSVHPRFRDLLRALGQNPALSHLADPGGWERLGWMYQPRGSLSEQSLAEAASPTGIAERESQLNTVGRTPAEVFQIAPDAVVALAESDAGRVLDRQI